MARPISGKVLGISGIQNFRQFIADASEVVDVSYPEVDIQKLPYPDCSFDCVITDQVLEHVEKPTLAVAETYRVLRPGGVVIHTTCFINYLHYGPKDYWRFSADGLRCLCADFSGIIACEGWGNRLAILLCFISDRFRGMNIPDKRGLRRFLATLNEERYPVVTWIIAKK
ncbi:MAG: methyltransferase domain-containing protein [Elusimicrobiales bacterium]|nr:methyltransferase domain-containing protein [Elusimicrobiales bacterium]